MQCVSRRRTRTVIAASGWRLCVPDGDFGCARSPNLPRAWPPSDGYRFPVSDGLDDHGRGSELPECLSQAMPYHNIKTQWSSWNLEIRHHQHCYFIDYQPAHYQQLRLLHSFTRPSIMTQTVLPSATAPPVYDAASGVPDVTEKQQQ